MYIKWHAWETYDNSHPCTLQKSAHTGFRGILGQLCLYICLWIHTLRALFQQLVSTQRAEILASQTTVITVQIQFSKYLVIIYYRSGASWRNYNAGIIPESLTMFRRMVITKPQPLQTLHTLLLVLISVILIGNWWSRGWWSPWGLKDRSFSVGASVQRRLIGNLQSRFFSR